MSTSTVSTRMKGSGRNSGTLWLIRSGYLVRPHITVHGSFYRHKGLSKKSPYTVSFFAQVVAIFKRQLLLKFQDTFGISTGYATSVIIAFIVGSVYFRLPATASGSFNRGGLLFLGLLFSEFLVP